MRIFVELILRFCRAAASKQRKAHISKASNNVNVEASADKLQVSKVNMVQLDVVLQEQHVRLTKMKKTKCVGSTKRLTPECEAIMLSALGKLQLNVEALIQSTPAADRTAFKVYAYDRVANLLHLLTRISSLHWRKSFADVWQGHVFAGPLSTRYEGPNLSNKDEPLAAAKIRAHDANCQMSGLWETHGFHVGPW